MPKLVNHLPELVKTYKQKNPEIKQEDIALQADIHPVTLSRYINSQINSVNLDVWIKLSNFFQVPGHEIFDIED